MSGARHWQCDMNNRVELPRLDRWTPPWKTPCGPGWTLLHDGTVQLVCACGVLMGSPTAHSIDADGTINASIICDRPSCGRAPCGWHVFARLIDWPGIFLGSGVAKVLPVAEVSRG